jgi:CRP-like cAMP-binding protein
MEEAGMADAKVDLIASIPIFSRMGRRELEEVAQLVDEVDVPAGRVLMRQGSPGSEMVVLVEGQVEVERNGRTLGERGPGAVMGELSLLSEGPRTATVTTTQPSRLLVAGHGAFHQLMEDHPSVRLCVLNGLADKIRTLDDGSVH